MFINILLQIKKYMGGIKMTVDTEKDNISINKIIKEKVETIEFEGDSIVPDVKPDVIKYVSIKKKY